MGFGGRVSLIGCTITAANRLPASFFVSVAYDCWAFRRLGVLIDTQSGAIKKWLYRDPDRPVERLMAEGTGFQLTGREIRLEPPLSEEKVRALKVGDVVLINGPLITGRDGAHHYLMHHDSPCDLRGAILYHCGPVMLKEGAPGQVRWRTNAAGPTTSIREEPYEAEIIQRFGIRAVMGKGGMGKKTLAGLKEFGAVYLHAIGGAAQFYARCLPRVTGVDLLDELGVPEAMWHFEARDFPAIVTMDSHGNSLHEEVATTTGTELEKIGARD
jgi:fumarate hydratase class I